jgi:6-phosphofructo-2-kinase/fructose-2,6-biphosphatase 2
MTEAETNGFFAPQMRKVPTGEFVRPSKKTNGAGVQAEDTRICVVMVGLPARGKSLIAQKGTNTTRLGFRDTDMIPP